MFAGLRVGIGMPLGDAELAEAVRVAKSADRAVVFVGRSGEWDTEGSDLESIRLPGRQDELVRAVLAANPRTVVVLQTGGSVEMPWIDMALAVLQAWYPGQEAGNAIADVLLGVEPGGRLAQTFPRIWAHNPTHSQDREIYPGLNGHVRYEAGVFIGYRHYDRMGTEPLFAFGHGLSYTSFELSDVAVTATGVAAVVTNTGARAGSTVVQVYVGDVEASVPRPKKELKGFAKVHLAAGESRVVRIALDARAFAFLDVTLGAGRVEAGAFEVSVGFASDDLPFVTVVEQVSAVLPL